MNLLPGTKIKRIGSSKYGVEQGKIYTVLKKEYSCVWLKEIGMSYSYSSPLFELVSKPRTQSRMISWL